MSPSTITSIEQRERHAPLDHAAVIRGTRLQTRSLYRDTILRDAPVDPDSIRANAFIEQYLRENCDAADVLRSMRAIIADFEARMPRAVVTKCIDGRVHGSKGKGYPPGTITFSRTEGNNVDESVSNTSFWNRIDRVVLDAKRHTGKPALFIALGHRSNFEVHGQKHGCAAHGLDDDKAFDAVLKQAQRVRQVYKPDELFAIAGMTNTDDMSERLVFQDGHELDTEKIIASLHSDEKPLSHPSHVFQSGFLDAPLDDELTAKHANNLTPREMLEGDDAPMYRDLRTALAMQTYLVREMHKLRLHKGETNAMIDPRVFKAVHDVIESVEGMPESLKSALLYQGVWNVAYALYQRNRIAKMDPAEQEHTLDHAEELVCYGEGFDTLARNTALLVKTGRGDDEIALNVARKVLMNNRSKRPQEHPPVVHVNVEVPGEIAEFDELNDLVLSRIMTMLRAVRAVFAENVRIVTSYSYKSEKRFYPIRIHPETAESMNDPTESYPVDVLNRLSKQNFSPAELDHRKHAYMHRMSSEA